jgi:hypothetical protein
MGIGYSLHKIVHKYIYEKSIKLFLENFNLFMWLISLTFYVTSALLFILN